MRTAFGEQFDVPPGYLNTASIGIPPARVADAVAESVARWRSGADSAPGFDESVAVSRAAWAGLVGVDPGRVAIGASVSQQVGMVAAGVPDGTRVVVARGEFTSATFPFAAQAGRGVTVTEVDHADLAERAGEFDLAVVSIVQSAGGAIADLAALRACGARVLLDATQAVGWLPLDLGWADWVVGAGYKWLLSPRGAAWLAIRPDAAEWTHPVAANWYAGEDPWDTVYDLPLRLAADARAYDLAPVWLAHVGAAAALPWLASLDRAAVHRHCVGLADDLLARLDLPPRGSAIVSLDLPGAADRLAAAGIRCAVRAGRARLACHIYNTEEDVADAVRAITRDRR
ncbi:aminotransferase class V-fold PLP-dependent enzyme [Actinokineospora iranica]|uniref:Selenocysteine lyase/Cysteine desulfurase n=1 Tax=Actinokineospora iranica TaxID=1271860 RepID=A0A1G6KLQ7_9PSEU|nr:aminotransferase class V-fold PLP-dependent enzyme [Actinokineospora iranica]SDC32009.1 Selenocysteine lyase/Cysteine desulfurase [Actinokineospora iranica]